jgi:hypothetical protein
MFLVWVGLPDGTEVTRYIEICSNYVKYLNTTLAKRSDKESLNVFLCQTFWLNAPSIQDVLQQASAV